MPSTHKTSRQTRSPRNRAVATIHDVAARAGVSVATVSRVLNGKSVVRDETRVHVHEAAKALRYVPNVAARSLSIRRSHTIGIVLPDVHGEFFSEVIRDRKSTRLNSSHTVISYAVFCLKKKKIILTHLILIPSTYISLI